MSEQRALNNIETFRYIWMKAPHVFSCLSRISFNIKMFYRFLEKINRFSKIIIV